MLEFLKTLNTDYGNLLMFAVPLATVSYAYHEYRLKRQPVVLPELTYEVLPDDIWQFVVALHNLGMTPAVVKRGMSRISPGKIIEGRTVSIS